VKWYEEAGFSGCVLKGHYDSTVGRAAAANTSSSIAVYGGIVLNSTFGGFNPIAVDVALELGARIVWMPTMDARASQHPSLPKGRAAYAAPPVDSTTEGSIREILALIADADAVLATGHLSTSEVVWVVRAANEIGVQRVLITHPTFTVPAMTTAEVRELVELGAYAEITAWQLLYQQAESGFLAQFVREIGYSHCVLSSDAGQPTTPPAPEALTALVDALVAEGLKRREVEAMASEIPEALVVS
jgi:hypothetical protein